jgi:hypothetical protein
MLEKNQNFKKLILGHHPILSDLCMTKISRI